MSVCNHMRVYVQELVKTYVFKNFFKVFRRVSFFLVIKAFRFFRTLDMKIRPRSTIELKSIYRF